jgi:hypothetical protein
MMRTLIRALTFAAVAVLLAACASMAPGGTLQTSGEARVFDLALDTQLDWARIHGVRMEQWTIDGPPLNQLTIVSRVKPGEHVFLGDHERKRRPDGPWFRTGMRPDELRDIIVDGLTGAGWANVESDGLRPARFGDVPAVRFTLRMDNPGGLAYRGMAAAAERDGRLTVLVWFAPVEHYYGRDEQAVAAMLDSVRFVE